MHMAGIHIRCNHLRRRNFEFESATMHRWDWPWENSRPFDRSTGRVATFPTKLYNGDKQRRFLSNANASFGHYHCFVNELHSFSLEIWFPPSPIRVSFVFTSFPFFFFKFDIDSHASSLYTFLSAWLQFATFDPSRKNCWKRVRARFDLSVF